MLMLNDRFKMSSKGNFKDVLFHVRLKTYVFTSGVLGIFRTFFCLDFSSAARDNGGFVPGSSCRVDM